MGMKLDAPVATNALDSSGEILSIKGLDITDFLEGRAVANWEHSNTSEDGAVGRFIYAKKIFSEADCENERQLSFWRQLQHEFLYGVVELFDDEGHPGAVSIAAMARYFLKRKEKIRIGMSIEGSTLDRDGHLLNRAVARKAAITLTPCNKECWIDYVGEDMPVSKSESVEVVDFEFESFDELLDEIEQFKKNLEKSYDVAPGQLTGHAALARESFDGRTVHNTLKAVLRDWDKKKPLKDMVKAALPQLTENFIDHFTTVAQEMAMKKSEILAPEFILPFSPIISNDQQSLLEGLAIPDSDTPFEVNAAGQKVILRAEDHGGLQAAYSFLMDRYFGLGHCFPTSNHFTYKDKNFTAELIIENSVIQPKEQFRNSIAKMKVEGTIYKIYLADLILGKFSPRTNMSLLFSTDAPVCTYTNDIFNYDLSKLKPMNDLMSDMIPLDVIGWLESKNGNQLKLQMSLLGLNRTQINEAVRIKSIIEMNRHQTIGQILAAITGADQNSVITGV